MGYSENVLPKDAVYYTLYNSDITNDALSITGGGYAEIRVDSSMLPALTSKMMVVIHPSEFRSNYTNNGVNVTMSILTLDGVYLNYLLNVTEHPSGVYTTIVEMPNVKYNTFSFRISSEHDVTIYNWELCSEVDANLQVTLDGVTQSLPKVLYDYNTYAFAVTQREYTIGSISGFLTHNTDLQGHFTFSFYASEYCNVYIRIKDNGITELYTPVLYTANAGYNTISIPHAYLSKVYGIHNFTVQAQCTNGQLSVPTRGVLYTIDGGYLMSRLLDAGIDVLDIAIKQINADYSPSSIYAIGFESNVVVLKSRDYELSSNNNTWSAVKSFGDEVVTAALDFRGTWVLRGYDNVYTLETDDNPVVAIVDLEGNLYIHDGLEDEEPTLIDTNVTSVALCQGYKSEMYAEQDQGLVVAYVKDGSVYYNQNTYSELLGAYTWSTSSVLLYDGATVPSTYVSVHRLNDYRIGVCVATELANYWYLSARTYVNQAVKPDTFNCFIDEVSSLVAVIDSNRTSDVSGVGTPVFPEDAPTYNSFSVTFKGNLTFINAGSIDELLTKITVQAGGVTLTVTNVYIVDNVLTVITREAIHTGIDVTISINYYKLVQVNYNGCYYGISQNSYIVESNPPEFDVTEPVTCSVGPDVDIEVIPIITRNVQNLDTVASAITPNINSQVKYITTTEKPQEDEIDITVAPSVTISVILVGDTPV